MKAKYIVIKMLCVFTFACLISCKKDEAFVNLTATLTWQHGSIVAEEGQYIGTDLELTEELSEDLYLKIRLDVEDTEAYINPEDFESHFEYSTDNGQRWIQGTGDQVIFPSRTRTLRIRKRIVDDDKLELHERFRWRLEPQSINNLQISGTFEPISVRVKDNEANEEGEADHVFGALFSIDEQYNTKLVGLNRSGDFPERLKMMVDNGRLDDEILDKFKAVVSLGGVPVIRFDAFFGGGGIGGFTYFQFLDDREGEVGMGINLKLAYENRGKPQAFNENGLFGYVLTHEYGHVMTLNSQYELDENVNADACDHYALSEGCAHEDSAINQFHKKFYETEAEGVEPFYVTEYASSNIGEDIAESFAYAIVQDELPPLLEGSSTALQKVYQVAAYPRFQGFRDKIRNQLKPAIPSHNKEIRSYVNTTRLRGQIKPISCLDHQALWELYQKEWKAKH